MKTERIQVSTAAGRGLEIERVTPKMSRIILPNRDQVIFWEGKPIATYDGSYVYLLDYVARGAKAAINKYWLSSPILLLNINDFDYAVGQVLSKAGLMLVRRLDA